MRFGQTFESRRRMFLSLPDECSGKSILVLQTNRPRWMGWAYSTWLISFFPKGHNSYSLPELIFDHFKQLINVFQKITIA